MKKLFLFFGLLVDSFLIYSQKENILVTDLLQIKTVTNPQFSPDKQFVLYQQNGTIVNKENANEFDNTNQLMLYSIKDKTTKALTDSRKNVSSATFSPDGKYISFIRTEAGKTQLYLLDRMGGEPFAIGNSNIAPGAYEWTKNGKSIYFLTSFSLQKLVNDSLLNPMKLLPGLNLEKPGISGTQFLITNKSKKNPNGSIDEIRAYLQLNEVDKKAKVFNKLNFQDETTTNSDIRINQLFKIDLEKNQVVSLVSPIFENWLDFQINKSSTKIYAIRAVNKSIHPDKVQETEVIEFDILSQKITVLKSKEGIRYSNVLISPNEKQLVYSQSKIGQVQNGVYVVCDLEKDLSEKNIPVDRVLTQIQFNEEGSKLFFTIQDHGGVPLVAYNLNSGILTNIRSDQSEGILGFDEIENQFVYNKTKISDPSEVYLFDGNKEIQISDLNTDWLKAKNISRPEKFTFKNSKGMEIDYWVMKPTNFVLGNKYPLLLEIHGGPTAMWGTGELSMWHEFQYFAAKGYGIVYSNPRGSGGYGTPFMASNVNDWGKGPMEDVMQALNLTVKQGWADTSRLAVTGGSYAGYLVSYMVGHTNKFKVACAQRGVYELTTFMGEGNAWRLVPNYFGGYPWEKATKTILDRESPYSYVHNIKTPLIIFHGENDLRTGVIQSEMLYKSLKILNRDVEYVRHPGASHEITRSGNNRHRIDQMLRTYEFFTRYIK